MPLVAQAIIERYEGRLAAHGQAHILRDQLFIDRIAQRVDILPLGF